jgi:hydrogenase expression/formation protein HypE
MEKILLDHGSGGKLSHNLINEVFLKSFKNKVLEELADAAILEIGSSRLAFSCDSYVVKPIFFPGGDIGKLAIYGTVNDLSMMGATPLFLSCALIIEEGLSIEDLKKIVKSMKEASIKTKVEIVAGDTKVVESGSGDKIFINTTGIGIIREELSLSKERIKEGDLIIINGSIGEHSIAILNQREGLSLSSNLQSDCAPLNDLVKNMLMTSRNIKFMRDPTRGGLATILNEVVYQKDFGIVLFEDKIPLKDEVKAACEIMGFDPLYMANEGKLIAIVSKEDGFKLLEKMREHPLGRESAIIGEVVSNPKGKVILKTLIGGGRIVDMLSGAQLPRIC